MSEELKACPFCGNPNYFLCPCDVEDYIDEITNLRTKLDIAIGLCDDMNNYNTNKYTDYEVAFDEVLNLMYHARAEIEKIGGMNVQG